MCSVVIKYRGETIRAVLLSLTFASMLHLCRQKRMVLFSALSVDGLSEVLAGTLQHFSKLEWGLFGEDFLFQRHCVFDLKHSDVYVPVFFPSLKRTPTSG